MDAKIKYFQDRINEMKTTRKEVFVMFLADYRKSIDFYENAKTKLHRSIDSETETKMANKYAKLLLCKVYLNGKDMLPETRFAPMQQLNVLSQLHDYIEKVAV